MNDSLIPDSVRTLGRVRGVGVVARLVVLVSPVLMTGCTYAAAGQTLRPLTIAIGVLTIVCVVHPDTHAGLLMVTLLGLQWLVAVDDPASPWSLGAVTCLALFHSSLAAATVAPPSARWTPAMARRWGRRGALLLVPGAGAWSMAALLDGRRLAGSAVLIIAALTLLTLGGVWAGTSRSPSPRR